MQIKKLGTQSFEALLYAVFIPPGQNQNEHTDCMLGNRFCEGDNFCNAVIFQRQHLTSPKISVFTKSHSKNGNV